MPGVLADGVTSPPVFTVAMPVLLLVHALPLMGETVHVAGMPPVHRTADPVEKPMADIGYPFTVTTVV